MGFTILGTGSALPERSVSNDELSEFLDTSVVSPSFNHCGACPIAKKHASGERAGTPGVRNRREPAGSDRLLDDVCGVLKRRGADQTGNAQRLVDDDG